MLYASAFLMVFLWINSGIAWDFYDGNNFNNNVSMISILIFSILIQIMVTNFNINFFLLAGLSFLRNRICRVRTGHGKTGKSWNFRFSFFRPGKSWKFCPESWKII